MPEQINNNDNGTSSLCADLKRDKVITISFTIDKKYRAQLQSLNIESRRLEKSDNLRALI
jgi:hypothetical protein